RPARSLPVTAVPDRDRTAARGAAGAGGRTGGASVSGPDRNGDGPGQLKPGRHREATLYQALAGAGAGDGRTPPPPREAARRVYETSELPTWRRSGFWTTTLRGLDLDALEARPPGGDAGGARDRPDGADAPPDVVERTLPERPRAGRVVQSADALVHLE